jgi:hypothetical protein
MTTNANETPNVPLSSEIVITVDHVYLPLDDKGNVRIDWAATSVSTTKVLKRTRLKVPDDLALFLSKRDQAEILAAPIPSAAPGTGKAGL